MRRQAPQDLKPGIPTLHQESKTQKVRDNYHKKIAKKLTRVRALPGSALACAEKENCHQRAWVAPKQSPRRHLGAHDASDGRAATRRHPPTRRGTADEKLSGSSPTPGGHRKARNLSLRVSLRFRAILITMESTFNNKYSLRQKSYTAIRTFHPLRVKYFKLKRERHEDKHWNVGAPSLYQPL